LEGGSDCQSEKGKVVVLWGGYIPKLYDGHFIQVNKWQFDAQYGGKFLKKAKIITPVGKDRKNPDIP
jgi:hypothetical protein